jgi:hypothetical protein
VNATDAKTELAVMVAATTAPALLDADLVRLLRRAAVPDAAGNPADDYPAWAASVARAVGDKVVPVPRNGFVYRCTVAGTGGGAQPAWPTTIGLTVADGGATWVCDAAATWVPTYSYQSLNRAAAAGWREKAARLTNDFDVKLGAGKEFARNQKFAACERRAAEFDRLTGGLAAVPLVSAGNAQ